jgi:methionyl-tRNA synthetase
MITIDQFAQVEMKVGLVVEAAAVEGSEKLIRQVVDFGAEKRIVFSGIKKWYQPEDLVGKKYIYVTNLEPRKMLDEESQAMILGVETGDGRYVLLEPAGEVGVGERVR